MIEVVNISKLDIFNNTELNLNHLNIFSGKNSTGKTSVIEYIVSNIPDYKENLEHNAIHYLKDSYYDSLLLTIVIKNRDDNNCFTRINFWLKEFGFNYPISVKLNEISGEYEVYLGDLHLDSHNISVRKCFFMIISLLFASYKNLIIFEYPENFLHPFVQNKIGELICLEASSKCQIILETNSDIILNSIRISVKYKKLNQNLITIFHFIRHNFIKESFISQIWITENGKIEIYPAHNCGFFDEYEKQLEKLVFGCPK